jgi:thymidylate kinase
VTSGKYIVIEGPDGTGKTTQAKLLAETLQKQGYAARYVHEPGETPMGLELEKIIKNRKLARDPQTDLLLFTANRLEVYRQIIRPALDAGDYFESKPDKFQQDLLRGYEAAEHLMAESGQACKRISAGGSIADVHGRITEALQAAIAA